MSRIHYVSVLDEDFLSFSTQWIKLKLSNLFACLGILRCRVGWTAKLQVHVLFASHVILRYSCQTGHVPRLNHWEE